MPLNAMNTTLTKPIYKGIDESAPYSMPTHLRLDINIRQKSGWALVKNIRHQVHHHAQHKANHLTFDLSNKRAHIRIIQTLQDAPHITMFATARGSRKIITEVLMISDQIKPHLA